MEGDWIMSLDWTGLKWYSTKEFAQNGLLPSGTGKVNTEIFARLNFFDGDVKRVFVDWDDGENQTFEDGIYQWDSLDNPSNTTIISHTYTATGTFSPLIRTVNDSGFISKYYGSSSTNSDVSPYEQVTRIAPVRISDKKPVSISKIENKTVRSGIDNSVFSDTPKDLYLGVAPLCTRAQLEAIGQPKLELTVIRHIVSGTTLLNEKSGGYREIGKYTVTVNLSGGIVSGNSDSGLYSPSGPLNRQINPDNEKVHQLLKVKYLNPKVSGATYDTNVGLNRLKMFIAASGASGSNFGNSANTGYVVNENMFFPVTYITAGDPVKQSEDNRRSVLLDWSQSRAAASNINIQEYLYDTGKAPYQVNNEWGVSGTNYTDNYAISGTNFNTNLSGNSSSLSAQYTYMVRPDGLMCGLLNYWSNVGWTAAFMTLMTTVNTALFNHAAGDNWSTWAKDAPIWKPDANGGSAGYNSYTPVGDQFLVDDYDRFTELYHLSRVQAKAKSGEISKLEHFDVLRVTPSRNLYSGSVSNGVNIEMSDGQSQGRSAIVTSGAALNSLSQSYANIRPTTVISGTAGILQDWLTGDNTSGAYRIGPTTTSDNSEYLLLMLDRPFNKIHFNISPYVSGGNASGAAALNSDLLNGLTNPIQVQASYLRLTNSGSFQQKADLVPLRLTDTTKYERTVRNNTTSTYDTRVTSLAKSGYITYDTPSDWTKTSFSELAGSKSAPFGPFTDGAPSYGIPWTGTVIRITGPQGPLTPENEVEWGAVLSGSGLSRNSPLLQISSSTVDSNRYIFTRGQEGGNFAWIASGTKNVGWFPKGNQYGINTTHISSGLPQGLMYIRGGKQTAGMTSGSIWEGVVIPINMYDAVPGFLKFDTNAYGTIGDAGQNYRWMFDSNTVGSGTTITRNLGKRWINKYVLQIKIKGGLNRFPNASGSNGNAAMQLGAELHNLLPADNAYSQIIKQIDTTAYNLGNLRITSDLSVSRQGNYYQAMSKGGTVYIVKLGDKIATISFSGKGMGDEQQFRYSNPNTMGGELHLLHNLQRDNVRVYWDETQKDGTFVRFFGVITQVQETHSVNGPLAPRSYSANMTVEEVCLLDASGMMISDIESLGGIKDARDYF
tara:strand:- start:1582 stop:4920 length:3339 start_codon:yes stop_codon:yes gene_type:complete